MKTFSAGWVSEILLRNYVMGTIFFSFIHIPLYVSKSQGIKFKFNPNWPEKIQKLFTFNKQIFDNLFWSLFWGVPIWTAYEVLSLWFYASGKIPFTVPCVPTGINDGVSIFPLEVDIFPSLALSS